MSDSITTENEESGPFGRRTHHAQSVRYSLKEMLGEVATERRHSAMGRELLDATEIGKMFADKRHHKRAKK